jgi:hypothetical protein
MFMNFTALDLSQSVGKTAFKLFTDPKFRQLCLFDSISQLEQDRIFNELVIAVITLIMLTCDAPDLPDEQKTLCLALKEEISKAYLDQLKAMGIEKKFLKQWKTLIDMRYNEYTQDKSQAREAAMIVESEENDIDLKKLSEIQLMLPMQTVAIGCHHHVCRSKTDGRDELFKMILNWLGKYYVELRVLAEGKTIHPLVRLKVGLRRFLKRRQAMWTTLKGHAFKI